MITATEKEALKAIKHIVDCYYNDRYDISVGDDDFNIHDNIFDISVIMGMICNHVYEGLKLPITYKERRKKYAKRSKRIS